MQIEHNFSLLPHNTFGMDVLADTIVSYDNAEELSELLRNGKQQLPLPLLHIGEGSNLLFMHDFPGTVFLSRIRELSVLEQGNGHVIVRVGAGWNMDRFIAYSLEHGWYGIENLSKIPGQVGASAVQNIGAYGVEAGDYIYGVNCVSLEDGTVRRFSHDECNFAYRHSIFKEEEYRGKYAVCSVEYRLDLAFKPQLNYGGIRQKLVAIGKEPDNLTAFELRDIIINIREEKLPDPHVLGNAGSFFMNPVVDRSVSKRLLLQYPDMPRYDVDGGHVKIPAAWLIEQSGWKGKSLGRVGVHVNQPLVLVNLGGATGTEIKILSDRIINDVFENFGIRISPEVNFI